MGKILENRKLWQESQLFLLFGKPLDVLKSEYTKPNTNVEHEYKTKLNCKVYTKPY